MDNTLVSMIRPDLIGLPECPVPEGYTLRTYQSGDETAWVDIHVAADLWNRIGDELFRQVFGRDDALLAERQFFLCEAGGRPIGTATGWFVDDYHGARWGRVHWVALRPEFHGRGLAKPLLAAACLRLVKLGHDKACLMTSTARTSAIGLYLSFGFEPEILTTDDRGAWREALGALPDRFRSDFKSVYQNTFTQEIVNVQAYRNSASPVDSV